MASFFGTLVKNVTTSKLIIIPWGPARTKFAEFFALDVEC
jgi:hypothetical protein